MERKKVAFAALEAWHRCYILFPNTVEATGLLAKTFEVGLPAPGRGMAVLFWRPQQLC